MLVALQVVRNRLNKIVHKKLILERTIFDLCYYIWTKKIYGLIHYKEADLGTC